MADNFDRFYPDWTVGTLTITSGSNNFTATNANLQLAPVRTGDTIITPSGLTLVIATINTNGNGGTLFSNAPAAAAGTFPTLIRFQSDNSRFTGQLAALVSLIGGGQLQSLAGLDLVVGDYLRAVGAGVIGKVSGKNLDALAGLTGAANRIPYFTGTTAMGLLDVNNLPLGKIASAYNWLINGNFTVNQRGATAKAQPVGVYGYDRWRGHVNGIEQVVVSLPAGEYTLTWSGGGNGTFGSITKTSPIKATVTGGNRSVIVPATATKVSLVSGDATGADPWPNVERPLPVERELCLYYFFRLSNWSGGLGARYARRGTLKMAGYMILPHMRVSPSITILVEPTYYNCTDLQIFYGQNLATLRVTAIEDNDYRAVGGIYDFDAEVN